MSVASDNPFFQYLRTGPLLFDGGMGSMLIAEGLKPGAAPEEWNLSRPDIIRGVHEAYLRAGSDVVSTNSFGATPSKLESHGLRDSLSSVNNASVRLAREAIDRTRKSPALRQSGPFVAFSVGPTGKMLPPVGQSSENELEAEFAAQFESLDEPVDVVLLETFFDLREGLAALRAATNTAKSSSALPGIVGISLTFNKTPRGFFTIMGDTVEKFLSLVTENGADFVASNCSITSPDMLELATILRAGTDLPVLCQPNAGNPAVVDGMPVYHQRPEDFAGDMSRIIAAGINAVGGCCGTDPDFIRHTSQLIK